MSTRKIATQEGIAHFLVWEVLHEQLLHPYHMQKVREHYHGYPPHRLLMCNIIAEKYDEYDEFLFTDEVSFTRYDIKNYNTHRWYDENPYAYEEIKHLRRYS